MTTSTTSTTSHSGGTTPAQAMGMTHEIGRAAARLAADELAAGRVETARRILEGLAIANPHDVAAWTLLALVAARRGERLAALVFSGMAHRLAPRDEQVRLVRAEILLGHEVEKEQARHELADLARGEGATAARARALQVALG